MLPPPPPFDEEIVSWCAAHEILLDALRHANACAGELERARAPRPAAWHVPALPVGVANRVCPTSADDGDAERRARAVAAHESALARACDARDDAAAALAEFEERAARARRALRASAASGRAAAPDAAACNAAARVVTAMERLELARAAHDVAERAVNELAAADSSVDFARAAALAMVAQHYLPPARAIGRMRQGLGEGERAPAGGECEVVDVCLPPPPSAEMPKAE